MVTLQEDILGLYNELTVFSKKTLDPKLPCPITVKFEEENNHVLFEQNGTSVRLSLPLYYCLGLEDLKKPTYLLIVPSRSRKIAFCL